MTKESTPSINHPAFQVKSLAGMKPWACSYQNSDGIWYCVTLYGTDKSQVLEDNCTELNSLKVEGELIAEMPANEDEALEQVKTYNRNKKERSQT